MEANQSDQKRGKKWQLSGNGFWVTAMSHRYTHVGKEALAKAAASMPEI